MADIELCPHVCVACGGCDLCCPGGHDAARDVEGGGDG